MFYEDSTDISCYFLPLILQIIQLFILAVKPGFWGFDLCDILLLFICYLLFRHGV